MKIYKAKKLNTSIRTVTDFRPRFPENGLSTDDTTVGDPTNTTVTIVTTVNTGFRLKS